MSARDRMKHVKGAVALLNSYGPGAGRPKKPKGAPPGTAPRQIPQERRDRARELRAKGTSDLAIARALAHEGLLPGFDVTDRTARDAARQKARRAADRK